MKLSRSEYKIKCPFNIFNIYPATLKCSSSIEFEASNILIVRDISQCFLNILEIVIPLSFLLSIL